METVRKRILVLHSYPPSGDGITSARIQRLQMLETIHPYSFQHTYVCLRKQWESGVLQLDELVSRLEAMVVSFDPDLLLVHCGGAFMRFSAVVVTALGRLKLQHSAMEIVIEKSPLLSFTIDSRSEVFSESLEAVEIRRKVFGC